jgi:hypothetical protein
MSAGKRRDHGDGGIEIGAAKIPGACGIALRVVARMFAESFMGIVAGHELREKGTQQ